ncbi:synaptic vesicle membrane protein VAT-1 homolog [Caerostris darwini]|uniref:Synaptic vesicle membrane protein VAT-1 homolog n=1 Tax=Caerostris darwini TaxID=1538125 RepID=A0AAV4VKK7_9ARAC|nr:synaptic vesicle membrane protein VAT-1 homolog [Caerostris darwini]
MADSEKETGRAIILTAFGGYDKLKIQNIPKLCAEKDHIIIDIKACGMNFSDLYVRQGIYTYKGIKPPFVLGTEASGIVSEIGPNVTEFKIGDRVLCWNFTYGMWSEYVHIHKSQCYPIPLNMTFAEANGIVNNYLTAYLVLMDFGNLRPGQNVLIQAAAGGVGWAATQIAKSVENVKIFGTASLNKHDIIKENGVTHAIDYNNSDFVKEVLTIAPHGVDVILDCLSGDDFTRSQKCLKHMGRLIHIGISSMIDGEKVNILKSLKVWWQTKNISIRDIVQNNHAICGLSINNIFETDPNMFKTTLDKIMNLYQEGKIKPRIDSIWSFDEVIEATKCMVERKNIGKIILVPKKEDNVEKVESYQN